MLAIYCPVEQFHNSKGLIFFEGRMSDSLIFGKQGGKVYYYLGKKI